MAKSLKFSVTHASAALIAAFFISFMLFYAASVHAAAPDSSDIGKQRRAEALTQSLLDLGQAYQHANAEAQEQAFIRLQEVVVERYELLLDLIENDPATILRVAVPNSLRTGIPDALRGFVEQRVEAQGELEVLYEDYEDGTHKLHHFLEVEDGVVSLHFKDHAPQLLSGQQVAINGLYLGFDIGNQANKGVKGALLLDSGDNLLLLGDTSSTTQSTSTSTSSAQMLPNTTGEQRALVLVFNFTNSYGYEPWSLDFVRSRIFGDVNDWYNESSYGKTWFTGDVHGYFTLPINSTCSTFDIKYYADAAAQADGIDVNSYDRIIYLYPRVSSCGWGGQATVGGSPSRAYLNGSVSLDLAIHEVGHNFGLLHSHSIDCGSVPIGDTCSTGEYGDLYDTMGAPSYYHYNAFQKERLGWLTEATGDIVTVNSSGNFFVEPYEITPGNYPKVLKISRDAKQDSWYYLEFRQAIGYDSILEGNDNILNGLIFHNASPSDANSSNLLDMTTNTLGIDDAALEYGNSYTDPITGVTVTTGLPSSTGIYAEISSGQQSCVRSKPMVSFLTTESPWVSAGTDVNYSLTVTNNDSSACGSSSFNLASTLPQGWTGTFSPSSTNLSPGSSAALTLTVTSSGDAVSGFYDVMASVSSSTSGTGSDTATYIIENTISNSSPVAVDDSVVLTQTSSVTINVLNNDYDPDQDQIVIDSITQGSKGSVKMNADSTLTYTPAKRFKDSDSFTYSIIDGEGGMAAAMVLITLQASSGGDSTGGGNTSKGKGKPTN